MLFSALESYGVIRKNPAKRLTGLKITKNRPSPPMPEEQYSRLVAQIDSSVPSGCRDRAMIGLLRKTAVWLNDLLRMNLQDIDLLAETFLCGESRFRIPK